VLLAGALCIYGVNNSLRITEVRIVGADASLAQVVTERMHGSYLGLVPRDSILFYPKSAIRERILASSPDVAALSFAHEGASTLIVTVMTRTPIARWCPAAPLGASSTLASDCYVFDAHGVLYTTATTTILVNHFTFYEPFDAPYIGATLPLAETFPRAFDFARELATFGSPVVSVTYRNGEVDVVLESGTRVTYVQGDEQRSFTDLVSAKGSYNLSDGSIDYIDLRFPGKVYMKRKDAKVE
jgi:hypothetical protein